MSILSWIFGEPSINIEEPGPRAEPTYWWQDSPPVEEPSDSPWW